MKIKLESIPHVVNVRYPVYNKATGEKEMILNVGFCVKTFKGSNKLVIRIPKGALSDGASIPRFLWRIIGQPYDSKFVVAGFVHDFLYRDNLYAITRSEADDIFYQALVRSGTSKAKALVMYYGVRWFGAKFYKGGN